MKPKRIAVAACFGAILLISALGALAHGQIGSPGNTRPPKTWALVIGISKYALLPGGQQLQFADRDAIAFADALKKTGVDGANVRTLLGTEANTASIRSAAGTWLARSTIPADMVYIFFSGHGFYEREFGESYLFGFDSNPADPYATAISISELQHLVGERIHAARVVILADAIRRDFFDPEAGGDAASAAFIQAFERLSSSREGVAAMLANGPGEFSREGQRWNGMGVFTSHLIEALGGKADRSGSGIITAHEAFDFVSSTVADDTSNKQHPWRNQPPVGLVVARMGAHSGSGIPASIAAPARNESGAGNKPAPASRPLATPGNAKPVKSASSPSPGVPGNSSSAPRSSPAANHGNNGGPASQAPGGPAVARQGGGQTPGPTRSDGVQPAAAQRGAPSNPPPATPPSTLPPSAPVAGGESKELAVSKPPSRGPVAPPSSAPVSAQPAASGDPGTAALPVARPTTAPSPLILQFEAALTSGNLLEPKSASAWDLYQKLAADQSVAAELPRYKARLADALANSGKSITGGDVRVDNISERVDDFRRAGLLFARARALAPDDAEFPIYQKLSAAQALIALQFYDEAERSLAQLQSTKAAALDNALGILYSGKLDAWRAERAFKRAVELEPKWAIPHYNLGVLYRGQQKDSALEEFVQAAALAEANPVILSALGDEYFGRQNWKQAADAFRKAIAVKPSDDTLHTKLGHALFSQGLQQEANYEYDIARQLRGKQL